MTTQSPTARTQLLETRAKPPQDSSDGNLLDTLPDVVEVGDEYECELTSGGIELCNGLDNNCDGEATKSSA